MDWKEGTLNSEKCTRSLLLLKWLASVRTEESFSETGPKSQRTALRFQKTGFPLVASSSSQNGTKEYNKLVNKMSNTGTEAQLDNEGRESVAKLKSEMKSICVSSSSRWAVLEPTPVLAAAACSLLSVAKLGDPKPMCTLQ